MPVGAREVVINDANAHLFVNPVHDGETKKCGTLPRDWDKTPHGSLMHAKPFDLPLIPESEWQGRLDAQVRDKAQLSDVRNVGKNGSPIPSRDQDGKGYCLVAGTLVAMGNGDWTPVESVVAGDEVLTHKARIRKVIRPTSRQYTGDLIAVKSVGDHVASVECTVDHPFLTLDGSWVEAGNLTRRHEIFHAGYAHKVSDYLIRRAVVDHPVYCLEVEEDHSFIAAGYAVHNCWFHSGTSGMMIARAIMGEPYADLSAYMGACIIKDYQDEGGWGSEGVEWVAEHGICTSQFWPQQSMSRSNDTPEMRANAKLHRWTEWMDLDPNQTKAQLVTCLLLGIPVVTDYNWWSHSVLTIDLVSLNPFRTRIWNSWGDSWSENGTGVLEGDKAMPDSALGMRVSTASP